MKLAPEYTFPIDSQRRKPWDPQRDEAKPTLYSIPDNSQRSPRTNKVVTSPHAKNTASHNRISNVIDARASGVEEHGHRANELTGKDNKNALPPIQADADHGTAQRPIPKGETQVEGYEIPPSPCSLLWRSGIQVFITPPLRAVVWMSMFVQRRLMCSKPSPEAVAAAEGILEIGDFLRSLRLELGDTHSGVP